MGEIVCQLMRHAPIGVAINRQTALENLLLKLTRLLKFGTPSERRIAKYLLEHLAELPFETAATLAQRLNLSPMTVGRFIRSLGYQQFSDIRQHLRDPASLQLPQTDIVAPKQPDTPENALSALLLQQVQSIQNVYDLCRQPVWQQTLDAIASSEDVFIVSCCDAFCISDYLHSKLLEQRGNVHHLREKGAGYVAVFDGKPANTTLIIVDCGGNPAHVQRLGHEAVKAGYTVVLITGRYYEWGPGSASICLMIPLVPMTDHGSAIQLLSMIEFLACAVTKQLQSENEDRSQRLMELSRALAF
mgnify:CR=1 FL=1|jgi:DNA-binding MurR/RpiR family transcriptional regulator